MEYCALFWCGRAMPLLGQIAHQTKSSCIFRPTRAAARCSVKSLASLVGSSSRSTCVRLVFSMTARRPLAQRLILHRFGQLSDHDFLYRECLRFVKGAFFLEEAIEARSAVPLTHNFNSLWRLRANANSSSGVFCAILMNPCRPTGDSAPNTTVRAIRWFGRAAHLPTAPAPLPGTAACRPVSAAAPASDPGPWADEPVRTTL